VEKFGRLAGDVAGTRKAAVDIVELCFKNASWKMLNDQIVVLSKRRGQLKQVCSSIFAMLLYHAVIISKMKHTIFPLAVAVSLNDVRFT
jgi:hypothetical protein